MHVPSLRYLQMIQIIGFEKSSRGYRILYACGDQLLNNIEQRYEVLDEACETLAVPHIYLNTGISKLIAQRNTMQKELEDWRRRYFETVYKDVEKNDKPCLYRRCEGYTPGDVRQLAKMVAENSDKASASISKTETKPRSLSPKAKHAVMNCSRSSVCCWKNIISKAEEALRSWNSAGQKTIRWKLL